MSLWGLSPARAAQGPAAEYRFKSAFLYRIPGFVEWPAAAFEGRQDIQLCIVRPNPFDTVLRDLVANEKINGRLLTVRDIDADEPVTACHELFIPAKASSAGPAILKKAQGLPILTIGDYDGFLDDGGMIVLRMIDRRIRFEVATEVARRAGLGLSSQLLKLASNTR
jgi:hypothetical protein